jgi:hypothetical protein
MPLGGDPLGGVPPGAVLFMEIPPGAVPFKAMPPGPIVMLSDRPAVTVGVAVTFEVFDDPVQPATATMASTSRSAGTINLMFNIYSHFLI